MSELRYCRRCGESKPSDSFSVCNRAKSGKQTYCKSCQYRIINSNPELAKAREQRYKTKWPAEAMYRMIAARAARKSVPFAKRGEFCEWYYSQSLVCTYCGMSESDAKIEFGRKLHVDRKSPELGYCTQNMCLACHRCNIIKSKYLSYDQMMEIAGRYFGGSYRNAHDDLMAACNLVLLNIQHTPSVLGGPNWEYLSDMLRKAIAKGEKENKPA